MMARVCLADDEQYIRKSLRHRLALTQAPLEYCGSAKDGKEALELYHNQQPDIFFIDIQMPGINGLEVIRTIRDQYPQNRTHFIVISGFDDFVYLQQSIRLGVDNYIKKPIIQQELNDAVIKAIQALQQDERGKSEDFIPFEDFSQIINLEEIAPVPACLFVCKHAAKNDRCSAETLRQICQSTGAKKVYLVSLRWAKQYIVVYIEDSDMEPSLVLDLADRLSGCFNAVAYGLLRGESPQKALEQAEVALSIHLSPDTNPVVDFTQIAIPPSEKTDLDLLRISLERGELEACRQIISQTIGSLARNAQIAASLSRVYKGIVLILLEQFSACCQPAPRMLETELLWFSATRFDSWEAVSSNLFAYCDDLIRIILKKRQTGELTDMVCAYLEKHYMDDISLQSVANHFFISPSYLCKRFKEKKQITITGYLENIRMEKAKDMLESTKLSVSEICRLTGYNDANYFTRIFKRYYCMPPSGFRQEGDACANLR